MKTTVHCRRSFLTVGGNPSPSFGALARVSETADLLVEKINLMYGHNGYSPF